MYAVPFRSYRKTVAFVAAVVVLAAVAYDLSHVYRAGKLLAKRAGDVATAKARLDQVAQDMTLLSTCKSPKPGQPSDPYEACLTGVLPSLRSGVGMYAGVTLSMLWLTRHPDDKAVYAVASTTMDRLWDHYRQVDETSFRLADEATAAASESVLYRVAIGTAPSDMDADWRHRLKDLEYGLNDPQLARKQRERDVAFARADVEGSLKSPGQTTAK